MKYLDFEIYWTDQILPIAKPVQEIWHGVLLYVQTADITPLLIIVGAVIVVFILCYREKYSILISTAVLLLSSLLSVLCSLRVAEGWDELFINLRHSAIFSKYSHYSYNAREMLEGTVDFLPFFLVGLLGKLSVPLIDAILALTLCGNIVIIIAAWCITKKLTQNNVCALIFAVAIAVFPCVNYVGATGFTATLFTGAILWCIYFLFFCGDERKTAGLALLSILTLIRTEGIALTFLIWLYLYIIEAAPQFLSAEKRSAQLVRAFQSGILLVTPFILSLAIRYFVFGYAIPNPVIHKNTQGDPAYWEAGLTQLKNTVSTFELNIYGILFLLSFFFCLYHRRINKKIIAACFVVGAFCLLYYSGGGDWFPIVWSRYLMPFMLLFVMMTWVMLYYVVENFLKRPLYLTIFFLFLVSYLYWVPGRFNAYKTFSTSLQQRDNRWERIDALGYLGRFLKKTTPHDAVICSAEMATVMYFAERDLLDLLGIANPEVAHTRLNPIYPGDLMHRRRAPQTIDRHLPEIIGFFGMSQLIKRRPDVEFSEEAAQQVIIYLSEHYLTPVYQHGFNRMDIAYYRAGSLDHLKSLGYRYIMISTPEATMNYFVHDSIYKYHVVQLNKMGIVLKGTGRLPYSLNEEMLKRIGII